MPYEPWQPGMRLTANRLARISPTWQPWTPGWDTTTGSARPNFGGATLDCSYAISATTVFWKFEVVFAANTNFGGGTSADNWLFSLPVPAATTNAVVGFVELNASTGLRVMSRARCITTGDFGLETNTGRADLTPSTSLGLIDSASPWAWASGHALRGGGQYETAA